MPGPGITIQRGVTSSVGGTGHTGLSSSRPTATHCLILLVTISFRVGDGLHSMSAAAKPLRNNVLRRCASHLKRTASLPDRLPRAVVARRHCRWYEPATCLQSTNRVDPMNRTRGRRQTKAQVGQCSSHICQRLCRAPIRTRRASVAPPGCAPVLRQRRSMPRSMMALVIPARSHGPQVFGTAMVFDCVTAQYSRAGQSALY
jgi:hypothetical protein